MSPNNKQFNLSRRNSLKFVAGAIGTGILAARAGADLAAPEPAIAQNDSTPDAALQKLMDGNQRFVDKKRQSPNQDLPRLLEVAVAQKPFAAILGCADSRFPSEIIFESRIGRFICLSRSRKCCDSRGNWQPGIWHTGIGSKSACGNRA